MAYHAPYIYLSSPDGYPVWGSAYPTYPVRPATATATATAIPGPPHRQYHHQPTYWHNQAMANAVSDNSSSVGSDVTVGSHRRGHRKSSSPVQELDSWNTTPQDQQHQQVDMAKAPAEHPDEGRWPGGRIDRHRSNKKPPLRKPFRRLHKELKRLVAFYESEMAEFEAEMETVQGYCQPATQERLWKDRVEIKDGADRFRVKISLDDINHEWGKAVVPNNFVWQRIDSVVKQLRNAVSEATGKWEQATGSSTGCQQVLDILCRARDLADPEGYRLKDMWVKVEIDISVGKKKRVYGERDTGGSGDGGSWDQTADDTAEQAYNNSGETDAAATGDQQNKQWAE